jgi:hypothetical protein
MHFDWLGFASVLAFTAVVGLVVSLTRLSRPVKYLVYAALALRVLGSLARHWMVMEFYGGRGDSILYFSWGTAYAERFWNLDFSPFYDPELWRGAKWWGTQFVQFPTGIIAALIGPTLLGGYVVFSLMAFVGLVGFGVAFHRSYPHVPVWRYLRWIWLFPSLWFWPSAIGKEAIVLMGLGLAIAGFIGREERINWLLLALGLFLVFAIRPQVAAVVVLSLILAQWLSLGGRWTLGKSVQGVLILGAGLGAIWLSLRYIGVDGFDIEGVQGYMEDNPARRVGGRSSIEGVDLGLAGVPLAMVNILARPFLWEARNPMMLISALEIFAFWCIAWFWRRPLLHSLRNWRSDRFLRAALPFVLVYTVMLGMMVTNLGIVARQRLFLFPFLFLLLEAAPRLKEAAASQKAARVPPGRTHGRVGRPAAEVPA